MGDLDHQLKALLRRYGLTAINDTLTRLTKPNRGRRPELDHISLQDFTRLDAIDLLSGNDPFSLRSNTQIANRVSQSNPGHSADSTHRRIMRKLARDRKSDAIRAAAIISYTDFPFTDHIRAAEWLAEIEPAWVETNRTIAKSVRIYKERFGEPNPLMTFEAIDLALRG